MTTNTPEDTSEMGTENMSDSEALALLKGELAATPIAEARGIAWCDMYGTVKDPKSGEIKIVKISLTQRSAVGSMEALEMLMNTIRYAKETYHMAPYIPSFPTSQPPKQESKPAAAEPEKTQAPGAPAAPAAAAPAKPVAAPANTNEGAGELVMRCPRIEVTPLPEDRVTVLFFDDNPSHKFPELRVTKWTVESVIKLLANTGAWKPENFQKADNFTVNYDVFYKLSKKTTAAGNPLKDVTRVALAS